MTSNASTSTAYTPGPWTAHLAVDGSYRIQSKLRNDPDDYGFLVVADTPSEEVCESYGISPEVKEANAKLIAAAPELLEALDALLKQTVDMDLEHGIELTEGEREARRKGLAAMAKVSTSAPN